MPLLSQEDQERLLGPVDGLHCRDCGWQKSRGYCRQCDEFYLRCACPIPESDQHDKHRNYEPLEAGALYLVHGNVLRCLGLYATKEGKPGKGSVYAFTGPREPITSERVGYSASLEHARRLTADDLPELHRRFDEAYARKLTECTLDVSRAIQELEYIEQVQAELDSTKGEF